MHTKSTLFWRMFMNKIYKQIDTKHHHILIDKGISMYMPSLYNIDGKFDGQILQTTDKELRKLANMYAHALTNQLLENIDSKQYSYKKTVDLSDKKTIFVFWYQNEMPEIVKRCYTSLQRHCANCNIVLITKENLCKYIDIDCCIQQALDEQRMTITTFSDYVRLSLLSKYNGLWLDATIYDSKDISMSFFEHTLLLPKIDENRNVYSKSWSCSRMFAASYRYSQPVFILGSNNSKTVQYSKQLFVNYFNNYKYIVNYFLVNDIIEYIINTNEDCKQEWYDCPSNNVDVEQMMMSCQNPYIAADYVQQSDCCLFKTSYKTNTSRLLETIALLEK